MVYVISMNGQPDAKPLGYHYLKKKVRCHNRQLYKMTIGKGGIRKANQAPREVKGYRLFDIVEAKNKLWYVHGRRVKGAFVLRRLNGTTLEIVPSKIQFKYHQQSVLVERRMDASPQHIEVGVFAS